MCDRSPRGVLGVDYETDTAIFLDTQCRCYDCPQCSYTIRRLHQARIIYGTKEYQQWANCRWSFVTLTSHERSQTFESSLALFQVALPKWRKRMKRRYGNYDYVLIFEQHKSGALHAHMLINRPVSKKWVRRHARSVGLGYIADVQHLHAAAAAGKYCSKYISKALSETKFPKRFKRVRYSHNWPQWPLRQDSHIRDWTVFQKDDIALHIGACVESGLRIHVDRYLIKQMNVDKNTNDIVQ